MRWFNSGSSMLLWMLSNPPSPIVEFSVQFLQQVESSKGHRGGKPFVMENICDEVHEGGGRSGGWTMVMIGLVLNLHPRLD